MIDLRLLEKAIKQAGTPQLFGPNSFPHADYFASLTVVETENQFRQFIDTCNKCFVESVENFGQSIGRNKYYWKDIKTTYPGLWYDLQRIKIYRHESLHLMLTKQASGELLVYLKQDLEGKPPSSVRDCYFILQQCVLDGLLTGIQIEIGNLT